METQLAYCNSLGTRPKQLHEASPHHVQVCLRACAAAGAHRLPFPPRPPSRRFPLQQPIPLCCPYLREAVRFGPPSGTVVGSLKESGPHLISSPPGGGPSTSRGDASPHANGGRRGKPEGREAPEERSGGRGCERGLQAGLCSSNPPLPCSALGRLGRLELGRLLLLCGDRSVAFSLHLELHLALEQLLTWLSMCRSSS